MDDLKKRLMKKIRYCNGKMAVIVGWFLACEEGDRIRYMSIYRAIGGICQTDPYVKWLRDNKLITRHGYGSKAEYAPTSLLKSLVQPTDYKLIDYHYGVFKENRRYCDAGYQS